MMQSTGVPSAPARCPTPESLHTTALALTNNAASSDALSVFANSNLLPSCRHHSSRSGGATVKIGSLPFAFSLCASSKKRVASQFLRALPLVGQMIMRSESRTVLIPTGATRPISWVTFSRFNSRRQNARMCSTIERSFSVRLRARPLPTNNEPSNSRRSAGRSVRSKRPFREASKCDRPKNTARDASSLRKLEPSAGRFGDCASTSTRSKLENPSGYSFWPNSGRVKRAGNQPVSE